MGENRRFFFFKRNKQVQKRVEKGSAESEQVSTISFSYVCVCGWVYARGCVRARTCVNACVCEASCERDVTKMRWGFQPPKPFCEIGPLGTVNNLPDASLSLALFFLLLFWALVIGKRLVEACGSISDVLKVEIFLGVGHAGVLAQTKIMALLRVVRPSGAANQVTAVESQQGQ